MVHKDKTVLAYVRLYCCRNYSAQFEINMTHDFVADDCMWYLSWVNGSQPVILP